jgi:hypothetical protein
LFFILGFHLYFYLSCDVLLLDLRFGVFSPVRCWPVGELSLLIFCCSTVAASQRSFCELLTLLDVERSVWSALIFVAVKASFFALVRSSIFFVLRSCASTSTVGLLGFSVEFFWSH